MRLYKLTSTMDDDEISSCSDLSEASDYLTDSGIEDEDNDVDPQTLQKGLCMHMFESFLLMQYAVKIAIRKFDLELPLTETTQDLVAITPKTALLRALHEAKIRYIFAKDEMEESEAQALLENIKSKAHSLAHTAQAFESEEDKMRFFRRVKRRVCQIIAIIRLQRRYSDTLTDAKDFMLEHTLATDRSQFAQEFVKRPWLQFLHGEAPAWPANTNLAPNVIARQKIPDGGIRIINYWEGEVHPILDFLDTNRNVPLSFESGLAEAQKAVIYSSNGTMSKDTRVVSSNSFTLPATDLPKLEMGTSCSS